MVDILNVRNGATLNVVLSEPICDKTDLSQHLYLAQTKFGRAEGLTNRIAVISHRIVAVSSWSARNPW